MDAEDDFSPRGCQCSKAPVAIDSNFATLAKLQLKETK
jgi:hypothetical protein